ncbi:cytochrome C and quinol oxidase polypeptide I [Sphingobacterium spiritivorum ATCC 33300]|uniref:Cytochrome C and quinol oxidase polypeptide I n=2 Tax=Sphingobacterium spiritivorum TaxID=258 RepID=D7VGY6_SPHSI|nr:cbb3-type cytochrome c oxidase subunit I [Sphingobacterium spiritivorum]EEI91699.1 cytochrome C and quinol oxidase polypeptide I [Sphingobacterium spiritivorum ATCC 33300]EFK59338.1 cytochrome C and quinol oxidase polypeptide I [Sphingobacterium spiritivorum ATCC 33861]WQD36251.1 cbb3-type cytochrome c oxidase subunit I [Sphingobacterium spiritivorum]
MDHKMIAKQFLITGIIMAVFAMVLSILFRIQLAWPDKEFPILEVFLGKWAEGGRIRPEFFLSLVTIHGTMMVFFVLTAGLSGTFSNLLIPYQIGARDMASPFMNMLSYWFFFVACVIMVASFFIESGPASSGWTVYPPLSAVPKAISGSGLGMTLWLVSMTLFIASQVMGGVNYISTVLNMRTKGMDLWKMPLTVWSFFLTAIVGLLSFPVLVSAVVLLIFDRSAGTSFYLSDLVVQGEVLPNEGGSPILFQHLFWFLGHPEVYIVVMPALGLTSEVISTNSRKPIFGYHAMVYSLVGITVLSFIVWGHHMFVTGMNPFLGGVFMITTLIIAVPSAVKAFNYLATLWRGNIRFTPAMMFAIGMVSFFISGGLTGLFLGNAALDINLHDTYFVVAHFHLVMGSASIFGMLCGVYHWYPKMFGKMMNPKLGYLHFWLTFIGAYLVFFPMHFMGIDGVPRRYYAFTEFPFMEKWVSVNLLITWAAIIAGLGQIAFLWNFFSSIVFGKKAPQNPWNSNTLEWTTPVEHIHGNWPGEIPTVHRWPYDYSKPGHDQDFIPQNVPFSETMSSNLPHDFEGNEEAVRIQEQWNKENNREIVEG